MAPATRSSESGGDAGGRPVLLLVEDSPEFAFLVTRLGERAGCAVVSCPDPQSALERIRSERPDLVLLDRNLAGQDGLDLVRNLGSVEGRPPVALFCHSGVSADQAEAVQAGVDFFFHKDLVSNAAGWEQRLREILARAGGRPPPGQLESPLPGDPVPAEPTRMDATREQTPDWVRALGQGLRHPALRGIGAEVVHVLLRRALLYALAFRPPGRRPDVEALVGPGIDLQRLGKVCSPAEAQRLLAFLADRFECLLGGQSAALFREALKPQAPAPADRPADAPAADPPLPRPAVSPSREAGGPGARPLSHAVLLVEDNEPEIAITQRAIRECALPLDLFVVRDGQEAMDYLLRQGRHAPEAGDRWRFPDLVLLDLNLPRLDGREVLQRIRATPSLRTAPVVILSNSRRPEDVRDLYAAGANTYIEKPHDFARFVEVMRTLHHYWLGTALLPPPERGAWIVDRGS